MDVINCKSCGRLYNYIGGQPYCTTCLEKLENKFKEIKAYLYDNPNTEVYEVSKRFEVSIPIIQRWIREERLSYSENSLMGIACERCGVTIKTGRYCKTCKEQLAHNLSMIYEDRQSSKGKNDTSPAQMRFFK